jgi:choline dehydrogenase-like flavoprotein
MTDAVVIGAGAGGGIVAKELARAGWSVVLLERGPRLESAGFGHVETRDRWLTASGRVPFGPATSEVRTVRADAREAGRVVHPRESLYGTAPAMHRARDNSARIPSSRPLIELRRTDATPSG